MVGLFAPPLLAATAIGAAIGAVGGKALHKKTGSKIEEAAGETIPIGGAGLIVAYHADDAEKVEPAVTRPIKKVVGEAEGTTSRRSRARSPTRSRRWPTGAPDPRRSPGPTSRPGVAGALRGN